MEQVNAQVLKDGKLILEGISAHIQEGGPPGGIRRWDGYFLLPNGSYIARGIYTLLAQDGRMGEIHISQVSGGSSQSTEIRFTGSGPFSKP